MVRLSNPDYRVVPGECTMRVPSYRLHKPSGQAVVTLDGNDVYLGAHGTPESHARYDRQILQWLGNHQKVPSVIPDITVRSLLNAYLGHVNARYSGRQSSEPRNIGLALRFVLDQHGAIRAAEFGPKKLKAVQQEFIKSGLCRNEVNKLCVANIIDVNGAIPEQLR
jgi:hypothetical protein